MRCGSKSRILIIIEVYNEYDLETQSKMLTRLGSQASPKSPATRGMSRSPVLLLYHETNCSWWYMAVFGVFNDLMHKELQGHLRRAI